MKIKVRTEISKFKCYVFQLYLTKYVLQAPVIYVPMHSKSNHCLTLDMGNLTVCNVFKKLEVTNEAGDCPIVDEMKIELQNLKLSR